VVERAVALETTAAILPERFRACATWSGARTATAEIGGGFSLDNHLLKSSELLTKAIATADGDRAKAALFWGDPAVPALPHPEDLPQTP
jgi:hypothetical protein